MKINIKWIIGFLLFSLLLAGSRIISKYNNEYSNNKNFENTIQYIKHDLNFMSIDIPSSWLIAPKDKNTIDSMRNELKNNNKYISKEGRELISDNLNDIILMANNKNYSSGVTITSYSTQDEQNMIKYFVSLTDDDIKENYNLLKDFIIESIQLVANQPISLISADIHTGYIDNVKYLFYKAEYKMNNIMLLQYKYFVLIDTNYIEITFATSDINKSSIDILEKISKSITFK